MHRLHDSKIDDAKYYEEIWDEETNLRPYYDAVRMRALIRKVADGDSVLDVGAGVFGSCQYIYENGENLSNCKLVCIDQSYTAEKIVKKICPKERLSYIVSDIVKLPFEDNSFDVVIAGEIIEHMEDPGDFVKELARVCKSGGFITMSTVNTKCENAINHGDYPEHIWEFEPEDLIDFFEKYGHTVYEIVGDYHFIECEVSVS